MGCSPRNDSACDGRGARDLLSEGLGGGDLEVLSERLRRLVGGERERRLWRELSCDSDLVLVAFT